MKHRKFSPKSSAVSVALAAERFKKRQTSSFFPLRDSRRCLSLFIKPSQRMVCDETKYLKNELMKTNNISEF